MNDILNKIVSYKLKEIEKSKSIKPEVELHAEISDAPKVRPFPSAIQAHNPIALIAEVKKASPSAGIIRSDFHPVEIARQYEQHGAACISVLTDENFFQGHLDFLKQVRASTSLPLLRKDFILDPYQIVEARAAGADCVLLIAECLTVDQLRNLFDVSREMGISALIEIYEESNLQRVLDLQPEMIGVNNRNLRTFVTDLEHSLRLKKQVPESTLFVSESGIRTPSDVQRLIKHRVHAMLVGETLMRADSIGQKMNELLAEH